MPRSYWRKFFSAIGRIRPLYVWSFNLGIWALLGLSFGYQYLDRKIDEQQAGYHYQPARDEVGPARPVTRQPQPKQYQPNCQAPVNRDDSDLCAQWSAVEAVNEGNSLARLNLWFSVLALLMTATGTSLLIWTLWETRQTARRELRAYITVERVRRDYMDKDIFSGFVEFVNRGATPAYILDFSYRLWVGEPTTPDPFKMGPTPHPQVLVKKAIGKDECDSVRVGVTLNNEGGKELIREMLKQDRQLYIYGWIVYFDVFKTKHYTFFSYQPAAHVTSTMREFVPTIRGNAAD